MAKRISPYHDEKAMRLAVAEKRHREVVGGMWDEIGDLQLSFLREQGLVPAHRLLDAGCGPLRGGVKFAAYLDPGNYFGIDISAALLAAGRDELAAAGLSRRVPKHNLARISGFDASGFGVTFQFGIAQSVFTHLPKEALGDCLDELGAVFEPGGAFYSTWFESPHPSADFPDFRHASGVLSHPDRDIFHASRDEIVEMSTRSGWRAEWIGDWGHPRGQQMLRSIRC